MFDALSDTQQLVASMYKDDKGEPIILSPGQDYIFKNIACKLHPRIHCMCHTRFGKSMTVGLGVLTRAATFAEKWAIIAGTEKKAQIIMEYVIGHIFDNDFTKKRFVPDKGDDVENIRRYKNKKHLTFDVGKMENGKSLMGEVYIGAAKDALGFGAPNVVEDESALINDNDHSLVMRMLGDNPHENFLIKIGNPFQRNHFLASFKDPRYRKVVIDCYKSLKEGRISQEIIDENKPYSFFDVLYECKFPSASAVDEQGYMQLLIEEDIRQAKERIMQPSGIRRIGLDVARSGRNFNVWVMRSDNYAQVIAKDLEPDLYKTAEKTIDLMKRENVGERFVFVDDSGVGGGVTDILRHKGYKITPVNFGMSAPKQINAQGHEVSSDYLNIRAFCFAGKEGLQTWVKSYGQLENSREWDELLRIRYKKDVGGKVKIEPKEDMRKRGIESPDVADALALTFAKPIKSIYTGNINPSMVLSGARPFGGIEPFIPGIG